MASSIIVLNGRDEEVVIATMDALIAMVASAQKQDDLLAAVATAGKQDNTNTLLTSISSAIATAAKQDNQITYLSNIDTKVATATKQDDLAAIIATATKQDTTNTTLSTINTNMATASKQDAIHDIVATATKQDTGNASVASIDSKVPALGQAVAAASVPVVLTAAQIAALTPFSTVTVSNFPATQPVTVAALPLPSGASTATKQDTGNASIASIDGKTPALGQAVAAASVPVVLTAAQITALTPLSTVAVSNFPATQAVSAATLPLPSGASTAAKQPALGTAGSPSTDVLTIQGATSMTPIKTDASATIQPVSAASLPLPSGASTSALQTSGNASLSSIDTKTPPLGQAAAAASMPVVLTAAQIATLTPLTSVAVSNFPATQPISAAALPLPSGASTAAKQPALGTAGSPSTDVLTIQGITSGTAIKTDASATTQPISASSLPLPSGAATSALQTSGNASLTSIDAKVPALGQAVAAASTPVVLTALQVAALTPLTTVATTVADGSNIALGAKADAVATTDTGTFSEIALMKRGLQSLTSLNNGLVDPTTSTTGTISVVDAATASATNISGQTYYLNTPTAGSTVQATSAGFNTARIQLTSSSFNGFVSIERSMDAGTTWVQVGANVPLATTQQTALGFIGVSNTVYAVSVSLSGAGLVRVRCTSRSAGTLGVSIQMSYAVEYGSPIPIGNNLIGKVGIDQTTPGTTNGVRLNTGSNIVGQVGIDQTTPGTTDSVTVKGSDYDYTCSLVRAANTTPYTANDVVGGVISFTGVAGRSLLINTIDVQYILTAIPSGMTTFNLFFFSSSPTSAIADNAAFALNPVDKLIYLGYIAVSAPTLAGGMVITQTAATVQLKFTTGTIYAYYVTAGGYTPLSVSETYFIRIKGIYL